MNVFLLIYPNDKKVSLNIPSPLENVVFRSNDERIIELTIKRDDLIHPLVSGNKWRKLSGHLTSFNSQSHSGLVTSGGPWSNHLLAAASAASIYNIPIIGFVRGNYYKYVNALLLRAQSLGMKLEFLSNGEFDDLQHDSVSFLSRRQMTDYAYIPMGGDDASGQMGCREIVNEVKGALLKPDRWLIASGTGTTACGVLSNLNYECKVLIFPAIGRDDEIEKLTKKFKAINSASRFTIMDPHRCPFGKVDQKFLGFIKSFFLQTGILLDPLYNGKMMESFINQHDMANPSTNLLAYHSGGLYGWEGIKQRYANQFDFSFLPTLEL